MQEEWKAIPGYDGQYSVSNTGKIKNQSRLLHKSISANGYEIVRLSKNKEVKNFLVHRLVAIAFIDNPNSFPIVNHKDENRRNNQVSNLEWCSYSYNNNYGTRNEKVSVKKSTEIIGIDENGVETHYRNSRIAAETLGCSWPNIVKVLKGKRNKAGGCKWKYASR